MATNIFSPISGRTYTYGGFTSQPISNIFDGVNPYYIQNTNPYIRTPYTPTQPVNPDPIIPVNYSSGDDSFGNEPPTGSNMSFGYGYSNTSPGYDGPYSNNPLDSERSFMDRLGEAASNYINNYSIFGIAANALSPYDPVSYAQAVGVAEPVTFSTTKAQDYINEAAAKSSTPSYSSDLAASGYNESNTSSDSWSESDYSDSGWSSDPSADAMAEAETSYDSF